MRKPVAAALACTFVVASAAAQAADIPEDAKFNIMGPSDCSRWPQRGSIESAAKAVPLNWVLGFLSGEAERTDPRLFPLLEPDKVAAWVDGHCKDNPDDSLPVAARALMADFEAQLPPRPPPMFVPPAEPKAEKPAPKAAAKPAARKPARKPAARKPAAKGAATGGK